MTPEDEKRACLVYVPTTAAMRGEVRQKLENSGYTVCEVEASLAEAVAVKAGDHTAAGPLADCISRSDLCIFLLPEEFAQDEGLAGAAGIADAAGKRIIGIVAGVRSAYPQIFDENAESMLRNGSLDLDIAIEGTPTWEAPDGTRAPDRKITRVRCQ